MRREWANTLLKCIHRTCRGCIEEHASSPLTFLVKPITFQCIFALAAMMKDTFYALPGGISAAFLAQALVSATHDCVRCESTC
jgi:hypothetical protein